MGSIRRSMDTSQQLEVAVRTVKPRTMARTFATNETGFYDRSSFDRMARETRQIYRSRSGVLAAEEFRQQLDRALCLRDSRPVVWDEAGEAKEAA